MTENIKMLLLNVVTGGLFTLMVYLISTFLFDFLHNRSQAEVLADFKNVDNPNQFQVRMGSKSYKIRSAFSAYGIPVGEDHRFTFWISILTIGGVVFTLLNAFGLGALFALVGGLFLGYLLVQGVVASKWEKTRILLEQDIPTCMRNLSGIIQTDPNVISAINTVRQALDPERPLHEWLGYFLQAINMRGITAFDVLLPEAYQISSALGLMVFEIHRLWESGGEGYTKAFKLAADNLSEILRVKAQASAKGTGALGLARLIILAAVVSIGTILLSPVGQDIYLGNPMLKLSLIAIVAWGAYGWIFIKDMVREAVE